ncbi:aldehyde dehydrogenase family protein [Pseudoclavibacter terrae]|uniref:Aldehyde dehydrogenase family protein n=1 Tax=Pseudoclavibacter terrae TaxID=1530195 RepID=A0A7J5B6U5_9MICO|nr:aldehyde dehydrogenase family protein [Pseudoclavibacter terrae]PPG33558.1 aldehyde dehydrogenase [Pseudoclavibacter sp. RFBB5]
MSVVGHAPGLVATGEELVVTNPADGAVVGHVRQHSAEDLPEIIERARSGSLVARALSRHARATVLENAAALLGQRSDEVARLIVAEAGKTIVQARKEVARCQNTLKLSAVQARSNAGEVVPFDAFEGSETRTGWFTREPLGIILAITPYNDALNLVAHKIGPAIAGGNSVILKPSQLTPLTARLLVDLLVESGLPAEVITTVHGNRLLSQALVSAREIRMVSFTGGFRTGEAIAAAAGIKKVSMELGGNAPVLVFGDADLTTAVARCVSGSFWAAGQNCIGTQRIIVHESVADRFRNEFVAATSRLTTGDPSKESTDVGPMISEAAADSAQQSVEAAVAAGARLLEGGRADGAFFPPTVLADVPRSQCVWADEAFAPIVVIETFSSFEEAVDLANEPEYALHAAVFTSSLSTAMRATRELEAGAVMVNDSSDYRFDAMPFGGAKYGSMGREGVRFAYEDMTQTKVVGILE